MCEGSSIWEQNAVPDTEIHLHVDKSEIHSIYKVVEQSHTCYFVCRGDRVREVDVLCYRDYTREGRRVTTHSLLLQAVKLPPKTGAQGEDTRSHV